MLPHPLHLLDDALQLKYIFFSATLLSFSGKTVKKRKLFSDYLGLVVSLEPDNYPDIRSLMERCQALVGTRSVHIPYSILFKTSLV